MSGMPAGGRGRGRGTGKEMGPDRPVIGMGRGKGRQITTPPSPPIPSLGVSTVPPEVEEKVRAEQAQMKELAKQLSESNSSALEGSNNIGKPTITSLPTPQLPQSSNLNPNCPEFIPQSQQPLKLVVNSRLNAEAPEFVPSSTMTAALPPPMEMFEPQIAALGVTVADMVAPFMSLVPDEELYLLDSAAELLLKCAASPELFDTEMDCLLSTIKQNNPDISTLSNMAKLVIIWGERDTTLQFVASKFCAHCFLPLFERGFTETFTIMVREKSYEILNQATEPQAVIRFSTFLAELFFRIQTKEGNPMWPFGSLLIQLIHKLLMLSFDQSSVMSIVNMLKLTGNILDTSDVHKVNLDTIATQLSTIIQGNIHNLPSHVCAAVKQLFELRSNQWSPPTPNVPVPAMYTTEDDTVYFMPTGNGNVPSFKEDQTSFQPQQQLPVVNPADWSEYIIEDDVTNTADNGNSYDADFMEEDDLEAAFEDFLQETHSHYRMFPSYHP